MFAFGHCPDLGAGGLPMPRFFAPFLVIVPKMVICYSNFTVIVCFLVIFVIIIIKITILIIIATIIEIFLSSAQNVLFDVRKKEDQVARIGWMWGEGGFR